MNRRSFMGCFTALAAFLPWGRGPDKAVLHMGYAQRQFMAFNPPGSCVVTTRLNSDFLTEIIMKGTIQKNEHGNFPIQRMLQKPGFMRVSSYFEENIFGKTLRYKTVDREIPRPNKADRG